MLGPVGGMEIATPHPNRPVRGAQGSPAREVTSAAPGAQPSSPHQWAAVHPLSTAPSPAQATAAVAWQAAMAACT